MTAIRILVAFLREEHLDEAERLETLQRKISQITVGHLQQVCRIIDIDLNTVSRDGRQVKMPFANAILNKVGDTHQLYFIFYVLSLILQASSDDHTLQTLIQHLPDTNKRARAPVLGIDVLMHVWEDMERTLLPSWTTRVPKNWASVTDLSADQTRTLCTVHLPITLIRLWHRADERRHDLLSNFLDLIRAVVIANMRTTSQEHASEYSRYIVKYMTDSRVLYPDVALKPVDHAALHLGTMLNDFGPVHAHSSPYYERYINFLHRVNTNRKLGEPIVRLLLACRIHIVRRPDRDFHDACICP